jgi:HJR/Mrr/RecB family endonuclease
LDVASGGARTVYEQAKVESEQASRVYQRLQSVFQSQSRRRELLARDWRSLRGIPFEVFLKEVFEELGRVVEATPASGDQGVDLIVSWAGTKVAVQAKGYADSVGNGAIQEVYAGMAFYGCQRCIVVTNSTFTAAAQELAARISCVLVDRGRIPDLIEGKIQV